MKRLLVIILAYFLTAPIVFAAHIHLEKEYQAAWSKKNHGIMEYVLPDKTRVDCVTKEYAIEFDFAKKWEESIGQALYYGLITHKQPAVVLILEHPQSEQKYLIRLNKVAEKYGIKVWSITPDYLTYR